MQTIELKLTKNQVFVISEESYRSLTHFSEWSIHRKDKKDNSKCIHQNFR